MYDLVDQYDLFMITPSEPCAYIAELYAGISGIFLISPRRQIFHSQCYKGFFCPFCDAFYVIENDRA